MKARQSRRARGASYQHLNFVDRRKNGVVVRTDIYFRHKGRTVRILADPRQDYAKFKAEYDAALAGTPLTHDDTGTPASHAAGTWNAAADALEMSAAFTTKSASTRKNYGIAIKLLRDKWGDLEMRQFRRHHLEALIDVKVKAGNYGSAISLLTVLHKLVDVALAREWIKTDITAGIKKPVSNAAGWRPYEGDEIARWRDYYPVGSMPRLAFELVYNHGLARADVIRVGPQHVTNGVLRIQRQKLINRGPKAGWQVAPITDADLLACLAALPQDDAVVDMAGRSALPFLRNERGEPFTADHFGYQWRLWARAAGLPEDFKIHGGRKSLARDAMDAGAAELDAMRLTGHADTKVFRHYAEGRSDEIAALRASAKVAERRRRA